MLALAQRFQLSSLKSQSDDRRENQLTSGACSTRHTYARLQRTESVGSTDPQRRFTHVVPEQSRR